MYTKFTRTISPKTATELAITIIEKAADMAFSAMAVECTCQNNYHRCSCHASYSKSCFTADGILYYPDYQSGDNQVVFPEADTLLLIGAAGSGLHTLAVNIATGKLTITHDGYRRSFPGNAQDLLPELWWKLNDVADWQLVEYQSSQPSWAALAGFLVGKHGPGPENAQEADEQNERQAEEALKNKYLAVGRTWPAGLYYCTGSGWCLKENWNGTETESWYEVPTKIPAWTGLEYRRASAVGVTL